MSRMQAKRSRGNGVPTHGQPRPGGAVARRVAMVLWALALVLSPLWRVAAQDRGTGGRNAPAQLSKPYVVLVSFDAFRHDYLDRGLTPHFDTLAAHGIRAAGLIPIYPSKTYPNHYSIATGMYAEHDGLVANAFYDPALNAFYRSGSPAVGEERWYGGEPLWVTAERQGMVAATMFWVGSEAPIEGIRPSYWHKFDAHFAYAARIQQVLDWLRLPPEQRPHFITLYFEMVDNAGHAYGPAAPETNRAIAQADSLLGDLMTGIRALPIASRVDVIVVSDHGMTPITGQLRLNDYVHLDRLTVVPSGPFAALWFRGDTARLDAVYDTLRQAMPHVHVYQRPEIPPAYHFGGNPRAGDILVVADEGYVINTGQHVTQERATHGYPPSPAMYGIFVAAGPDIAAAGRIPAFENIHVYPFITALLGLEPYSGIDGTLNVLGPYLEGAAARARADRNRQPAPQ